MTKQKIEYTSPRSEVIALHVDSPLLGETSVSITNENTDFSDKTSGLDFDDGDLWE